MKTKLKIALVCPYDISINGGVQYVVKELSNFLSKKGHYVKILTPKPANDISGVKEDNIIYIGNSIDFRSPLHTTVQVSASTNNETIRQILKNEKFDIINFHEPWVPFLSRQILQKSTSINVGTFHAKIPDTKIIKGLIKGLNPYLKSIIKSIDSFTACSNTAADYVNNLTEKEISIIPNFIDLSNFSKKKRLSPSKTKNILYVGRLENRKGVKYLIDAYSVLEKKYDNLNLTIAGDGPNKEDLIKQAKLLGIRNITFPGRIDDKQKFKLLSEADLFCSPAIYGESFGIVLLEAMAARTVIVCGNNPGYSELMKDIGAISVVDVKNITEFSDRLELLIFNNSIRNTILNWSNNYVEEFERSKILSKYENHFLKLVDK